MKNLLIMLMLLLPCVAMAQDDGEKYYIYNIFSFAGNIKKEGVKINVDNGQSIDRLVDETGKKIVFKTPAGALMYLLSQGWEMYRSGSTVQGESAMGYGETETNSYWIMRKPCSKEEFEKAVDQSIRN